MPIFELEVGGRKIEVDAPDMQTALSSIGAAQPAADPFKTEAKAEYEKLKAQGVPVEPTLGRRLAHGLTMGASDEILAAAQTPLEMIRRGTMSPAEGYRSAKAWQDVQLEEARKNQGVAGHIAEVAGGVGTGIGAARAGLSLVRPGASLPARVGALSAEGAAYGGAQGFLDAPDGERLQNAGSGAALGVGVGAALPAAGAVGGAVLGPIASNIRARVNPGGVAASQIARAVDESGRGIGEVAQDVAAAAREGQGVFTVADALGNPGQRMLSTVSRSPGPGRTMAVEFLEDRQAGQGRRVINSISEGLNAPVTAQQAEDVLTRARGAASDANYGAVRDAAGPVDISPVLREIDATINPGGLGNAGISPDGISGALQRYRGMLASDQANRIDFRRLQLVRSELSDDVERARRAGENNRARLLGSVLRQLDAVMENASQGFRQANAEHARMSRTIDAIGEGRNAAQRGRTEDILADFQSRPASDQATYRLGYADRLIENAQNQAPGVNKARPLMGMADELAGIAQPNRGAQMQRRLTREQQMFDTRNHAIGNSRTADNLADAEALKVDPSLLASIFSGDFGGAARRGLGSVSNVLHGSTPEVRQNMERLLLQGGTSTSFEREIGQELASMQTKRELGSALARALLAGVPVAADRVKNSKQEKARADLVNLLMNR
jgi:hypothetical protein